MTALTDAILAIADPAGVTEETGRRLFALRVNERLRHPPNLEPARRLTPNVLDLSNAPLASTGPRMVSAGRGGGSPEGPQANR